MKEFSDRDVPSKLSKIVMEANQVAYGKGEQAGIQFLIQNTDQKLQQFGPESLEYAVALNDHATFCKMKRKFKLAIESLRIAVNIPPTDDEILRNRLDCLIKLGEMLTESHELDLAEKILRANISNRRDFYGTDHEEFALGLYELAKTRLFQKNYDEAEALSIQAVGILERIQNPKIFRILVFRDLCIKAVHGTEKKTFVEYPTLHGNAKTNMFSYAIAIAKKYEPHYVIPFLLDLRDASLLERTIRAFDLIVIGTALAYNAKKIGNQESRISALEWTANRPEVQDHKSMLISVQITIGEAFIDIGNYKAAEIVLKEAMSHSKVWSKDEQKGLLFRQFGILYSKIGNKKKSIKNFQMALESANKSKDMKIMGRIQVSSGIAYHHRREFSEAKIMLEAGIQNLPYGHPERLVAYAHLALAIEKVKDCPCGNEQELLKFAYHGLLVTRGINPDQFELDLQLNETGKPNITVNPIYRRIQESNIAATEKLLQDAVEELRKCHLDSKAFQES